MKREVKIGILTIIAIAAAIWGYKFLKGQNILSKSNIFYAVYQEVDNLEVSSPVLVNGLQIGTVQELYLNPNNPNEVIVVLDVRKDLKIPRNAMALLHTTSVLGGKAIVLKYSTICVDDCAQSGDTLTGQFSGFVESVFPEETLEEYFTIIKRNIGAVMDTIGHHFDSENGETKESISDIKTIISNLKTTTDNLNILIAASAGSLIKITSNLEGFTGNLKQNNERITEIMDNVSKVSKDLSEMQLAELGTKSSQAVDQLNSTLTNLNEAGEELKVIMNKFTQSEGTLGLLMNDPALYRNLDRTVKNLDFLLQDLRLNPKRYVNVSVFGKRQKEYVVPEDDPAMEVEEAEKEEIKEKQN